MIEEDQAPLLKLWLLKKAGEVSDAEPEVLADYILALLNNKVEKEEELVKLLGSQLQDFVDNSESLGRDIIDCIKNKAYINEESKKYVDPVNQKQLEQKEAIELTNLYKPDQSTYLVDHSERRKLRAEPTGPIPLPPGFSTVQKTGKETILSLASDEEEKTNKLIVANLPGDRLEESILRNYFQRFGEILAVEIQSGSNLAVLEFREHRSATNAWSSPEPIFNNRFIKVFFKKEEPREMSEFDQKLNLEEFKVKQLEKQKEFEILEQEKSEFNLKLKSIIELKEKMLINYEVELAKLENQLRENPELEEEIKLKYEAIKSDMDLNGVTPILIEQDKAKLEGKSTRGAIRTNKRLTSKSPYSRPNNKLDLRSKTIIIKNISDPNDVKIKKFIDLARSNIEHVTVRLNDLVISFKDRYNAEKFIKLNSSTLQTEWDESSRIKQN